MFWKGIGLFMSFKNLKPMHLFRFSRSCRVFGGKGHGFLKTYGYCAKFLFSGTLISCVFCWSATHKRQILMGKIYLIYTLMVKIDLDDIYILYSLGWNDIFSIICGVFFFMICADLDDEDSSIIRYLIQYAIFYEVFLQWAAWFDFCLFLDEYELILNQFWSLVI